MKVFAGLALLAGFIGLGSICFLLKQLGPTDSNRTTPVVAQAATPDASRVIPQLTGRPAHNPGQIGGVLNLSPSAFLATPSAEELKHAPPQGWPLKENRVTSEFLKFRKHLGGTHYGLDLGGDLGDPIFPVANGQVLEAENNKTHAKSGWGNFVLVDYGHSSTLQGRVSFRFAHCYTVLVKPGDFVYWWKHIATIGDSGHSTASHLDWRCYVDGKTVDPRKCAAALIAERSPMMAQQ